MSDISHMTKEDETLIDKAVCCEKVDTTIDLALGTGLAPGSGIILGNCLRELFRCAAEELGVLRSGKPDIRAFPLPCGRWVLFARDDGTRADGWTTRCRTTPPSSTISPA